MSEIKQTTSYLKAIGLCALLSVGCDAKEGSADHDPGGGGHDEADAIVSADTLEANEQRDADAEADVGADTHAVTEIDTEDRGDRPDTFYCGKTLCSSDQICLHVEVDDDAPPGAGVGCANVPDACDGIPTCECVGEMCLEDCVDNGESVGCFGQYLEVSDNDESGDEVVESPDQEAVDQDGENPNPNIDDDANVDPSDKQHKPPYVGDTPTPVTGELEADEVPVGPQPEEAEPNTDTVGPGVE